MRCLARPDLDSAHPQYIAHRQRRALLQEGLEHPVGAIHPAQSLQRKSLGAGAVLGRKARKRTGGQSLGQEKALDRHLIDKIMGGAAGG